MLKTVSSYVNVIGALVYQGTWNALTNTPTLASSVGNKGDYYYVSVAGTTNLNGITDWQVGDFAIFNGAVWQKIDNTDAVTSVNGQTGAVVLTVSNIAGAVPNTVNVLAGGLLSGGGALTGNVTISLTSVPIANVSGAVPNTVNILAGTGLSGGGALTGNVTLNLANTAVTAATYGNASTVAQVTIDAQGRITNAVNVAISIASGNVTGLGTMATQNANAVVITGGTINNVTHTGGSFANVTVANSSFSNANITSVAATFPNSFLANSAVTIGNASVSLGGSTATIGNLTLNNVTINSGSVNVTAANVVATTNANATFATSSLPLVPAGYINVNLNGTVVRVPYYST